MKLKLQDYLPQVLHLLRHPAWWLRCCKFQFSTQSKSSALQEIMDSAKWNYVFVQQINKRRGLDWPKELCVPAATASGEVSATSDLRAEMAVGRHLESFQVKWAKVAEISDLSSMNKCILDWDGPGSKPGADQWAEWTIAGDNCWSELGHSRKEVEVFPRTFTKVSEVLPLDTAPLLNKLSLWSKTNVQLTYPIPLLGQSKKRRIRI